jgi:hypothetical protein
MMEVYLKAKKTLLTLFIFFPACLLLSFKQPEVILLSPKAEIVISNNTPTLTWSITPCRYYEIWIDGVLMDSIDSHHNSCTPFALSFGKHSWQVVAVDGSARNKSKPATFTIDDKTLGRLPAGAKLLRYGWKMQSSFLVRENGAFISRPVAKTIDWYSTSVPVTVLSTLVRNGVYPNPYVGINNMRIPDSNDEYNKKYDLLKYSHIPGHNPWEAPYWFRNTFEVPADYTGKTIWLNFSEINYRADVWLNGKQIADSSVMVGMERQFRFDVTLWVKPGKMNYLAVAIYPVDNPGRPANEPLTPLGAPGDNMGDGLISRNYTKWDAIGWDWQPAIRDREMGITEDVYLSATSSLEIENLYVTSDIPLPDTTQANLTISGDIINRSGTAQQGVIKTNILISNQVIAFEEPFSVGPNQSYTFLYDAEHIPQLQVNNPKLWWPVGYGQPNLYTLSLEVIPSAGETVKTSTQFGIREVETYLGTKERVIKINGQDIYCKGGNWVIDMMLNWNAKRYEDEILLSKNANLNILRVWGPTGVPPQSFYDAADKHGMLIWQDFLYDFWGTYRNSPGYSASDRLYEEATISIIKKYRNHPSLIMWCGGNEGPNPRERLIVDKLLKTYDGRDTRFYLKQSDGDGLHGGGPYHTISPKEYFSHPKLTGFSSEIGPSGVPVAESMEKFMPELGKSWLEGRFPIDATWAYHDANDWAGSDMRKFSSFDNIVRQQYGAPTSTDKAGVFDYLDKTQLVSYDVYRAAIESINRNLWTKSSGILLWKSNSSWPSMAWQLYDWYLQAHAGYYGVKSAAEPVHIQMNRDSLDVVVLNSLGKDIAGALISATLYDAGMKTIWQAEDQANLAGNTVFKTGWTVPVQEQLGFW